MQDSMTGAPATERGPSTHTASWRLLTDRCESTTELCRRAGEGWVIDPRRPPALISIAYLCEAHAQRSMASQEQLGVKARFVRGQTDERSRWLKVEWRVCEND